jgi:hypothetical protein
VSAAIEYEVLRVAANALNRRDPAAARSIADRLGVTRFTELPADRWAEALEMVRAVGADRKLSHF